MFTAPQYFADVPRLQITQRTLFIVTFLVLQQAYVCPKINTNFMTFTTV